MDRAPGWHLEVSSDEILVRERCPLCGASEREIKFRIKSQKIDREAEICECKQCTFVYSIQALAPPALRRFYETKYVASNYALYSSVFADIKRRNFEAKFVHLEQEVKLPNRSLLDLGCGEGLSMQVANRRGYAATGVELSERAVARARALEIGPVHQAALDSFSSLELGRFGLITLFDVLDHMADPKACLKEIRPHLAEGGALYIDVGNIRSIPARLAGRHWPDLNPYEHLSYFSRETLRQALEQTGFRVVSMHGTYLWATPRYILTSFSESRPKAAALAKIMHRTVPEFLQNLMLKIPVGFTSAIATTA